MKRISACIVLVVAVLLNSGKAFSQISFAVLPMEGSDVPPAKVEEAMSGLYQNLIDSKKYTVVDRQRIESIMKEQAFQKTGATDSGTAVEIGKVLGVDKLITSTIYMKEGGYAAISVSVIDVATAQVEFSRESADMNLVPWHQAKVCAAYIIMEYPLMGTILGITGDTIIVTLGKNHGLKPGDRLFVARKDVMLGDDGEVLFQEYHRIGTIEVTALDVARAKTKDRFLEDATTAFQKDDLVSPEPIPKKDPMISQTPLLPDVKKGALVLDDDMKQKKYLSVTYNSGESYRGGKVHLNACSLSGGHVYCYYPAPFDTLSDFIVEGETEFQNVGNNINSFLIVFRSNAMYGTEDSYYLFLNNRGEYGVSLYKKGTWFPVVRQQSTPLVNRGQSQNTFRIVAYGSQFDIYLNGQFLVGFEHELYEKGTLGFSCIYGGYITVDNVKVWEAVKR